MKYPLLLVCLILMSSKAMACSCIPQQENITDAIEDAYTSATVVVLAKAEHTEELQPVVSEVWSKKTGHQQRTDYHLQRTRFSVLKSWKGKLDGVFFTEITIACCVCGYHFEQGQTYLLYLYGPDEHGNYTTSSCSRTKSASGDIKQELAILDSIAH